MKDKSAEALKLIERLVKLVPGDEGLTFRALQIRDRISLPMPAVLEKVPGTTIVEKAAACGVSRQAYYAWLRGISRPNAKQATRLAKLTGYDAADIRGPTRWSARGPTTAVATRMPRTAGVA